MPKQEKIERVAELKERIEGSGALLLTEYRGLTVSEITELRRSLAEGGEGLGTLGLPESVLRALAAEAGFSAVRRVEMDNPFNSLYEVQR